MRLRTDRGVFSPDRIDPGTRVLGMRDAGYRYVTVDDCWAQRRRDAEGRLVPDPRAFPSGIRVLADYVHARGLRLGIYADAGTLTCEKYPGSAGYERTDAQTWAGWGVDLVKYDNCYRTSTPAERRYQVMADALRATGRDILFSVCEWGQHRPWTWAREIGGGLWPPRSTSGTSGAPS